MLAVLLLVLLNALGLEVHVGHQARLHRPETCELDGQKDAGDVDDIPGSKRARELSLELHVEGAGNAPHGHLLCQLLHLHLLELDELASARREVQLAALVVHLTPLGGALLHRREGLPVYLLVYFKSALVACVCGHLHEWTDVVDARYNRLEHHELTDVACLDLAQIYHFMFGGGHEAHFISSLEQRRQLQRRVRPRTCILALLHLLRALPHEHVHHVLHAVLRHGGWRHELVRRLRKQSLVPRGVQEHAAR
mmetsp:Transcript_41670/g.79638  ORF Transcript_41670/g.79638 Transcript_41670/m.79638 type:complete len:252 (-) Transcript_41670:283-1038(-)